MNPDDMQELARAMEQMPGSKGIDFKDVRRLAQLLREQPEIGSIELKGLFGTGVVITRTSHGHSSAHPHVPAPTASMYVAPPAPTAAAPATDAAPSVPAVALKEIRSPMVGTFYPQPEPGAEPYVRVGSRVSPGQTVCIIEAMKIMNEIEAEVGGVVREVCVDDSSPIEYGQVLFRVDPHG
jgi:acetyl-CoA carboxylase biotin carboxyl carrier protein